MNYIDSNLKVVGTRPIRPDGVDKVTGRDCPASSDHRQALHCRAAFHLFFRGARVQISDGGND